jgi:hypothetical protein
VGQSSGRPRIDVRGAGLNQDQPGAAQSAETDRMDERLEEEVERCALAVGGHGLHGRTLAGVRQ